MAEEQTIDRSELLALSAEVVASYVGNNSVQPEQVTDMLRSVFTAMSSLSEPQSAQPEAPVPAVPIKKSVTDDHIICLEDGKKLKMLKRHLMAAYGMTPEQYREKWGLRPDYPMVAPNYAAKRQELAKKIGLGRKPGSGGAKATGSGGAKAASGGKAATTKGATRKTSTKASASKAASAKAAATKEAAS